MSFLKKLKVLTTKYPVLRGMISYSIIWPTSSLLQQTVEGKSLGNFGTFIKKNIKNIKPPPQVPSIGGDVLGSVFLEDFL